MQRQIPSPQNVGPNQKGRGVVTISDEVQRWQSLACSYTRHFRIVNLSFPSLNCSPYSPFDISSKMLFKSLIAISIFAASAFAYDPIIRPFPKDVDVMKMAIPGNAKNFPGKKKDLNAMFPGQIHHWDYPPVKDLQPWPQQPEGSKRDECSLTIRVNVVSLLCLAEELSY